MKMMLGKFNDDDNNFYSDDHIDDDDNEGVADDASAGTETYMPTQGLPPLAMTGSIATNKQNCWLLFFYFILCIPENGSYATNRSLQHLIKWHILQLLEVFLIFTLA